MKKYLAIFLSVLFSVAFLSSCSKDENDGVIEEGSKSYNYSEVIFNKEGVKDIVEIIDKGKTLVLEEKVYSANLLVAETKYEASFDGSKDNSKCIKLMEYVFNEKNEITDSKDLTFVYKDKTKTDIYEIFKEVIKRGKEEINKAYNSNY